jgi:2'-5' RNA ligase
VSEEAHEESALIVAVPEVEALVAPFRARHDPAAAKGVPAHVTVLYPFVAPERITPTIVLSLAELFAALPGLRVSFAEVRRFPEALYLAPEPAEQLRRMTERVFARFPETPPYEGRFADVIPHLTVAHAGDPERLDAIAAEFGRAAHGALPIEAAVRAVELIVKRDGRWRKRTEFALGTGAATR